VSCFGTGCFLLYLALTFIDASIEVTAFTIGLQGIVAGLYLLLANVAYGTAPFVQRRIRPKFPERFQLLAFRLGVLITVLPFVAVPVLVIVKIGLSHQ
jgi:hypothetical protein